MLQERLSQPGGLAEQLRVLRERAGRSGKQLAAELGWQASKISRLERGRQVPSADDIEVWARVCGADDDTLRRLWRQRNDLLSAERQHRWRLEHGPVATQLDRRRLVRETRTLRQFDTVYVPGLLQTPQYARRVLAELLQRHGEVNEEEIAQAVTIRIQDQQLLYDPGREFQFLLAEPVLRWVLGGPEVMRAQLDRLQTVIGVANVRFGILPFGVALPVAPQHSFQLYHDVVVVDTFLGPLTWRAGEADGYAEILDLLWRQAATGEGARRLITAAAARLMG